VSGIDHIAGSYQSSQPLTPSKKQKPDQGKSLVDKKKEEDHARAFKRRLMEALKRKFRGIAENEILMKAYLEEKRKLEYQILRDNIKNEPT
jgi:hypothetical protein